MSNALKTLFLIFILLLSSSTSWAQKVIKGTIKDGQTGETLPAANILIEGAYRGTISNRDGSYSLSIPDSLLPAMVRVSYIGYSSQKRRIKSSSTAAQNFTLNPSVSHLQEIVVTDKDPGLSIMERVIKRKQQWRKKLNSYEAEAYTRQNLSNDTSLVMITESASKIYWGEKKGHREVLKWRRQTANINAADNFAGVSGVPNFYDDNIDIAGFDMVGVTNPDALSYYDFKLLERLKRDGQTVYHIKVIPKRKLQPLFKGDVFVLDEKYALIEVNLKPNSVVRFPPPVSDFNLSYEQQFSSYGGNFWLPVDARISGTVKIGIIGLRFPRLHFRQLAKISDYRVNVALPDSLFNKENTITADSTSLAADSLALNSIDRVPLSKRESHAYATLDSTQTLEKAFKPHGFLTRIIDFSSDVSVGDSNAKETDSQDSSATGTTTAGHIFAHFSPRFRYNRVDEFFGGLQYSLSPLRGLEISANGGYSTGYKKASYGAGIRYKWYTGRFTPTIGISYAAQTAPRYQSQIIRPVMASVINLLGYPNYFDYYRDEGFLLTGKITDQHTDLSLKASFNSSDQTALHTQTGYDILGQHRTPRINPAINEGHLNSLELTAGYNLDNDYAFGVVGRKRIAFNVEYSDDALGSDFNFTRYATHIDWSFDTFYQRRIFPNTLNISLDAGTFSGQLPLQKFGIVDVSPGILSLFEGLRTVRFRPYEGEQFAVLNVEHNFRTVPFERLGLTYLVEHNIGVILFGGAAKTRISGQRRQQIFERTGYLFKTTDGTHLEAGISITGIFDLFRVDFAQRLDEPAFLVGIGLTRFL